MMGDELLPKRSPDKNQRLVMINDKGLYHVKYKEENSERRKKIAKIVGEMEVKCDWMLSCTQRLSCL